MAVRDRATTVGRIMTASTTPASSTLGPRGDPWKNHSSTGMVLRKGSTWWAKAGLSTRRPHSPTTMLGTAAIRSTATDRGMASQGGASSDRKAAVPTPTGTASTMARNVVTRVPTMKMPVG